MSEQINQFVGIFGDALRILFLMDREKWIKTKNSLSQLGSVKGIEKSMLSFIVFKMAKYQTRLVLPHLIQSLKCTKVVLIDVE